MKNVIKKIASIAMAFILLRTGSVVPKMNNIQGNNYMTAYAYTGWIGLWDGTKLDTKPYQMLTTFTKNGKNYARVAYKDGLISFVAPNFSSKMKRYYRKNEVFMVYPHIVHHDRYADWMMTTSGYYVPCTLRSDLECSPITTYLEYLKELS